jgi:ATP-dependent RNA helicase RhlE
MQLKKINPKLQEALIKKGLLEANELQAETFSTIKSGADCLIVAPSQSGKTTTLVVNIIQQLVAKGEESPRALVFVLDKEKVLELTTIFEQLGSETNLRVYGVHDKGDKDFDKNHISTGIDVLIGTPNALNELFSTAGYNVNRLRMFIIDDVDLIAKNRFEEKITRISNSIEKTQRLLFCTTLTEKVEILADKIQVEPYVFEFD